MTKTLWIGLAIATLITAVVVLLVTGGSPSEPGRDAAGDVSVDTEGEPPDDTTLADLAASEVTVADNEVTFEATLGAELPEKLEGGSLEVRWDVIEGGTETWIVQVNLNLGLNAALTSQRTDYGSSTIDDTLPGEVEIDGDKIRLTIGTGRIKGFPTEFQWRLSSTLDASLEDVNSALATDSLPDSGTNPSS